LSLSLSCPAAEPENDAGFIVLQVDAKKSFKEVVTPFVDTYCTRCHGQDKQRGGINFAPALKKPGESASGQRWKQALAVVKSHKMPPDSAQKQPTDEERKNFLDGLGKIKFLSTKDPGPFVIRRLTKVEYGNTPHDLFGVVIAEVTLHLMGYGNLEVYDPDPRLYWRLKPNQNCFTKVNHEPVRINSLGTRGPEFQSSKPAQTFRILSLGDSRTFGWGLTEDETYSARLGHLLQEKFGTGRRVEVINAGVNGWAYDQMYVYFRDVALGYHPDPVIVGEGNGWTQFSEKSSPEFIKKFRLA
jgi:hypothetical protein